MSAGLIAFLFSLGAGTWVYVKMYSHTGRGNGRPALIGAGATFVLGFIVLYTMLRMILH